jgi:hypothetical protein
MPLNDEGTAPGSAGPRKHNGLAGLRASEDSGASPRDQRQTERARAASGPGTPARGAREARREGGSVSTLTPLERAQERMARASFDRPLPRRPDLTVVDRLARLALILEAEAVEGDGLRATVDLPRLARLNRSSVRRTRRALGAAGGAT